jgi:hypothetical protein
VIISAQPVHRRKGDHEAEQIEPERQHPQQRHRDDIGGQMRGRRQHQPRWHRCQRQPQQRSPPADRFCGGGREGCTTRPRLASAPPRGSDQQDQHAIAKAPDPALRAQRQIGFEQQRIGEQPGEAAQIGGGIEPVGIARAGVGRIPALHQRRLRRDDEEHRADRQQEQ